MQRLKECMINFAFVIISPGRFHSVSTRDELGSFQSFKKLSSAIMIHTLQLIPQRGYAFFIAINERGFKHVGRKAVPLFECLSHDALADRLCIFARKGRRI